MKKEVAGIPPMANEINLSANQGMKEEGAPRVLGPISGYLQILLVGYLTPMVGRENGLWARLCKGTPPLMNLKKCQEENGVEIVRSRTPKARPVTQCPN
jgi:hypothetical protein